MKLHHNELQTFSDLPQHWSLTTLGSFLPLTYGRALKKDARDASGNVPVYGSSGQVGVHSRALTQGPALIVGRKGSVGEVHRSAVPCWPIDTVYYADERGGADLKYCEHLLRGLRLSKLDKSTAIPGLSRDDYNAVEVAIAPLDQQKRIVAEIEKQFSRLDEAIANLNRVKANLKRHRAAVLKAAVEGRLVETEADLACSEGRAYETGADLLQRIRTDRSASSTSKSEYPSTLAVSDDHARVPAGWAVTSIGEIFDVYVGATPSRSKAEYWNGDIPWVSSGEVAFCRITQTRESITRSGLENSSTKLHPPGTVLLGMIGEGKTRGQVAILDIEACNNQNSAAIRVSTTDVLPEFVYSFLESEYETTRRRGSGGNQPALNKDRVKRLAMLLPPVAEQRRIVAEISRLGSATQKLAFDVDQHLSRLHRLRQSVLERAFRGGSDQPHLSPYQGCVAAPL